MLATLCKNFSQITAATQEERDNAEDAAFKQTMDELIGEVFPSKVEFFTTCAAASRTGLLMPAKPGTTG